MARPTLALTISALLLCPAPDAAAQSGSSLLEEITVTARKRSESLQTTPVAVTALPEGLLERSRQDELLAVERFTPNVELESVNFSANTLGASIRGLSFSDLEKTFDPTVGVSIDGVFLAWNSGALFDLDDVEQIEVLRGPQGTLYGRNTIGGTINVRRTRPTGEFGVKSRVRVASFSQLDANLIVNVPLIDDTLAGKFTYARQSGDSFTKNFRTGERDGGQDVHTFGAAFQYTAGDNFEALLSLDYSDDESEYPPILNLSQPGELVCDLGFGAFGEPSACRNGSFDIAEADGFETSFGAVPFFVPSETYAVTLEMDWELASGNLTSVTGYRDISESLLEENTGTLPVAVAPGVELPFFVASRPQESDQFSQELRFTSNLDGPLNYVAGLFYMNSSYEIFPGNSPTGPELAQVFFLGTPVQAFNAGQDTDVLAAFGELTYEVNDKLRLTAGARLTYENKDFFLELLDPATLGLAVPRIDPEESWTEPTWRLIADYQFTDQVFGYASYSRGFRSGGFNGRAVSPESVGPYDPETVDSFELGLRADISETLRINPTVFYATYGDKQEELLVGLPSGATETTVFNASEADTWGVEIEANARPTENLDLRFALGYLNYSYSDFLALDPRPGSATEGQVIDISGTAELRRAPRWTMALGADYTVPLRVGDLTFTANYKYTDEYFAASVFFQADPRAIRPQTNIFDVAVTLDVDRESTGLPGDLSFSLFGRDVFADGAGRNARPFDATPTFYFTNPEAARAFGLDISFQF